MQRFHFTIVAISLALGLSACAAGGRGWPNLAGDPPAKDIELLPPVKEPEPALLSAPVSASEAQTWFFELSEEINTLAGDITAQNDAFIKARLKIGDRDQTGDERDIAIRTAHFQLSRLSRIETKLATLLRQGSAALRTLPEAHMTGARMQYNELIELHNELADILANARQQMAVQSN